MRIIDLGGKFLTRRIQRAHAIADSQRPTGLHLSAIIRDFVETVHPNWFKEMEEERKRSLFQLGNVFEDVMAAGLASTIGWNKPEPRKHKGVWCSPDGYTPDRRRIDEIKLTWATSKDGLDHPKLQKYLYQVLGYMEAYDAKLARIHVFFINGDWRPPLPKPHTYLILPSKQDILTNWRMLMQHAEDRGML